MIIIVILIIVVGKIYLNYENTHLEVSNFNVDASFLDKFDGFTIAHISDFHNETDKKLTDNLVNKIKETNLLKYGVEHALQNPEIRTKALETNLLHYLEIKIPDEFKNKVLDFIKIEYPEYLNFSVKQKHIKNYQNYKDELINS